MKRNFIGNGDMEKVFVMIKPDGVKRGLVGECVRRFEKAGLKLTKMRMLQLTRDKADDLYPKELAWIEMLGKKTSESLKKLGKDITTDYVSHGKSVRKWLIEYVTSGPVVALVLDGNDAIALARKLVGPTDASLAAPGTIRGDLASDSIISATNESRANMNVIHVASDKEETAAQIKEFFEN